MNDLGDSFYPFSLDYAVAANPYSPGYAEQLNLFFGTPSFSSELSGAALEPPSTVIVPPFYTPRQSASLDLANQSQPALPPNFFERPPHAHERRVPSPPWTPNPNYEAVTVPFSAADEEQLAQAIGRAITNGKPWEAAIKTLETQRHTDRAWTAYYSDNKQRVDGLAERHTSIAPAQVWQVVPQEPEVPASHLLPTPPRETTPPRRSAVTKRKRGRAGKTDRPKPPAKAPRRRKSPSFISDDSSSDDDDDDGEVLIKPPVKRRRMQPLRGGGSSVRSTTIESGSDMDAEGESVNPVGEDPETLDSTDEEDGNLDTHKTYTITDSRRVAHLIADDPGWEQEPKGEKWKAFATTYPSHSWKAWAEFFRVRKLLICSLVSRYRRRAEVRKQALETNGGVQTWRTSSPRTQ